MKARVGIRFEGSMDIESIKIILKRIAAEENVQLIFHPDKLLNANGPILASLSATCKLLFKNEGIDIAVFLTDQDNKSKSLRSQALAIIKKLGTIFEDRSVVGVAKPHFEGWLIADEDTFKKIFFVEDKSLPVPGKEYPKTCLKSHHTDWKREDKPSLEETMRLLARDMDLKIAQQKSQDLRLFVEDFKRAIKKI